MDRLGRRGPRGTDPRPVCAGQRSEYELLRVLHAGSSSCVFRASERGSGRLVAIKALLDAPGPGLERALARFEGEVRILRTLRHPNIMPALDEGIVGERPFYVMDYAARGSLGHTLQQQGALGAGSAGRYLLEVLDALGYAHAVGVVHRDVKPDNILIDDADVARLVDFGIALLPDNSRLTYYGENLGTPSYIAPEQLADPSTVGPAADLFGLGATLFALVTAGNPLSLVSATHRQDALRAVPEPLVEIIEVSTRPRAAERYQSAAEMALALADALEALT